jgi:hypothetical protein
LKAANKRAEYYVHNSLAAFRNIPVLRNNFQMDLFHQQWLSKTSNKSAEQHPPETWKTAHKFRKIIHKM